MVYREVPDKVNVWSVGVVVREAAEMVPNSFFTDVSEFSTPTCTVPVGKPNLLNLTVMESIFFPIRCEVDDTYSACALLEENMDTAPDMQSCRT